MTSEIEDIFDDSKDAEVEPEKDEAVDAEESTGEGEPTEVNETKEAEPEKTETPSEPKLVPIAALHDERRKGKLLKEEVRTLKERLPDSEQKPNMYDDPEGYEAWVKAKAEKDVLDTQQAAQSELIEQSRTEMLEKHDDYLKVERVFSMLSAQDPRLTEELAKDPRNAAKFAYEKGKAYLDELRETERAAILAETKTDDSDNLEEDPKPELKAPSLATATAQASNSTPVEKEENLEDMFEDQAY